MLYQETKLQKKSNTNDYSIIINIKIEKSIKSE